MMCYNAIQNTEAKAIDYKYSISTSLSLLIHQYDNTTNLIIKISRYPVYLRYF